MIARLTRAAILILCATTGTGVQAGAQDVWLQKAHDARRTGQSQSFGMQRVDSAASWRYTAEAAFELNIGATVDEDGVYFGSWGLLRSDTSGLDVRFWNKSDGKLYGLDRHTGVERWAPNPLDLVARCYERDGRDRTSTDLLFCGLFNDYHVTFYNGTVEGQAALDQARGTMYVGRGDGKLYAIDANDGSTAWRFETYNPLDPTDPDGGGELIAAPLLAPDGTVYVGTWGEGPYETNAFYAVNPDGTERWRYPTDSSLASRTFASPALSPDGNTVYQATYFGEPSTLPGRLYALDASAPDSAADADRLKWELELSFDGDPLFATTLAVGSDGTVFVGGLVSSGALVRPLVAAVSDGGATGSFQWSPPEVIFADGAQYVQGIALREPAGTTEKVYVSTANAGTALNNAKEEGALYALDPATGAVLYSYDPSDDIAAAVGGLTSPAISVDGILYFGVRGRFGNDARNGFYFAVRDLGDRFEYLWSYEADGHVEWAHPAIGPDGGVYAGSGVQDENLRSPTYPDGEIPAGTSPFFYGFKGPTATNIGAEGHLGPGTDADLGYFRAPYPNPARDATRLEYIGSSMSVAHQIDGVEASVSIYDILGRRVSGSGSTQASGYNARRISNRDEMEVSVAGLAPGLYFMRVGIRRGTRVRTDTFSVAVVR